jgi:hypothetical protein
MNLYTENTPKYLDINLPYSLNTIKFSFNNRVWLEFTYLFNYFGYKIFLLNLPMAFFCLEKPCYNYKQVFLFDSQMLSILLQLVQFNSTFHLRQIQI